MHFPIQAQYRPLTFPDLSSPLGPVSLSVSPPSASPSTPHPNAYPKPSLHPILVCIYVALLHSWWSDVSMILMTATVCFVLSPCVHIWSKLYTYRRRLLFSCYRVVSSRFQLDEHRTQLRLYYSPSGNLHDRALITSASPTLLRSPILWPLFA